MDRLPLVQALTAAGLERLGAEQVATALGDAIESSVATKGDVAALKGDINRLDVAIARSEGSTAAEFSKVRSEMHAMEMRLTLRLGGLIVTATGVLFAVLRFAGHAP